MLKISSNIFQCNTQTALSRDDGVCVTWSTEVGPVTPVVNPVFFPSTIANAADLLHDGRRTSPRTMMRCCPKGCPKKRGLGSVVVLCDDSGRPSFYPHSLLSPLSSCACLASPLFFRSYRPCCARRCGGGRLHLQCVLPRVKPVLRPRSHGTPCRFGHFLRKKMVVCVCVCACLCVCAWVQSRVFWVVVN